MSVPVVKAKILEPEKAYEAFREQDKTKRIWDNYLEVGEVQKNNKIKFVFGAGIRDGVRYINVREFYKRQSDGVWKPGRDGITVPLAVPVEEGTMILRPYPEFLAMLGKVKECLELMDLYDEENAVYAIPKEKKNA